MAAAERHVPTRTCVACRTPRPQWELLRIVRGPDGAVRPDPEGELPGRGAYLCHDIECAHLALKRSSLERALRTSLPQELRSRLERADTDLMRGGAHGA
jgi:uncharacterized protein